MLFCLQGLLARLSQHEFHLGRDWPLEIGGRFACCSWVTSQEKTVSPKCDPQHRPLKTQKNTQSENFFFQLPTDICKVFFGSSIFRVYFTLGNGADSQAPSCTKFGPRSWFFISVTFLGGFARMAKEHGQFLHVIQVNTLNILQNSHSKIFRYDTCHRRTLLQHDFLSIFVSVFLSKLHKKNANHPDHPLEPTKITSPLPHPIFFWP